MAKSRDGLIQDATDPRLRAHNKRIKSPTGTEAAILMQTMLAEVKGLKNCVGLAAPQIGINKRAILVLSLRMRGWIFMLNPRIVSHSDEKIWGREGCLSHPGVTCEVNRYKWIKVVYHSLKDGQEHRIDVLDDDDQTFYPAACRIMQHEIDHLDGLLITDKWPDCREFIMDEAGQHVLYRAHDLNLQEGYVTPETD